MLGEALDVQKLLYTDQGKPRIAIVSIAHLNDAQRMFVVTLLLGEIVAWMRRQSGTSSLRALLYMDEIFGYFPPTATPPSKLPLLTLMKQARAFGLGVVLATQNPADLDYKGLSNAGTWFIGRLQTQRDKARVIEGLLSVGQGLDKGQVEKTHRQPPQSRLPHRNANDDAPVLFRTRWALSYLRGPLTLQEIARLQSPVTGSSPPAVATTGKSSDTREQPAVAAATSQPVIPAGVTEYHLRATRDSAVTAYAPRILGIARMHFVNVPAGIDAWETRSYTAAISDDGSGPDWSRSTVGADIKDQLQAQGVSGARYLPPPPVALHSANYKSWQQQLEAFVYENASLSVFRCPAINTTAAPGRTEADFRAHIALALREKRDAATDALRKKYAPRLATLDDQIRRGEERKAHEQSQLSQQKIQTAISIGTSILGAFIGRRTLSATNIGRVGTAARSAGRIGRESGDVDRAQESLEVLQQRKQDLENEFAQETGKLQGEFDAGGAVIDQVQVKARKSGIDVMTVALLWVPV